MSGPTHTDVNLRAAVLLAEVLGERMGFVTKAELAVIAASRDYGGIMMLVRCGSGRFLARAGEASHFVDIVTREGSDYVRDVAISADQADRLRSKLGVIR